MLQLIVKVKIRVDSIKKSQWVLKSNNPDRDIKLNKNLFNLRI